MAVKVKSVMVAWAHEKKESNLKVKHLHVLINNMALFFELDFV